MGAAAVRLALADARIGYGAVERAFAGYAHGEGCAGQRALHEVGSTGIPIVNVNNGGASGSTALFLAREAVESGAADLVLAVGFEQMDRDALPYRHDDRPSPLDRFAECEDAMAGRLKLPPAVRLFGGAGLEHMRRYGTSIETFAKVRAKASRHAHGNPLALFRKKVSAQEVLSSRVVWPGVMTKRMAASPASGAAAVVLCSNQMARRFALCSRVRIAAQALVSDGAPTFDDDILHLAGFGTARRAAAAVYEASGISPTEVDVAEINDGFAQEELLAYEALELCAEGGAQKYVDEGGNSYGGRCVVNPSGGMLGRGNPIGATGLAQSVELVQQLRGTAGARQVEGARVALQHNQGIGGACVVTLFQT